MNYLLFRFIAFLKDRGLLEDAYVVGGAVRDILLEQKTKDIDIALKGDVAKISREFAYALDASYVILDEDFSVMRIVKGKQWIDVSRLRCDSLFIDLSERDITINAMAIPLNSLEDAKRSLIDIYNGVEDLSRGIIRMVSEENFIKDPLRIMRVFRFAVTLDFAIERSTLHAVKRLVPLISSVAYERIAEELRTIILSPKSSSVVRLMTKMKTFTHIFAMTISEDSLENYARLENLIDDLGSYLPGGLKSFKGYLEDENRVFPLKFVSLFEGQKNITKAANQLRLSRKEQDIIDKIIENRGQFYCLYKNKDRQDTRLMINFLHSLGIDGAGIILIDIASNYKEGHNLCAYAEEMLDFYDRQYKVREPLLAMISGRDLISKLNIPPSRIIKKILRSIHIMILNGEINSPEDALNKAKVLYESEIDHHLN